MTQTEKVTSKYAILLNDYGYRFSGGILVRKGIRGFASERVIGRFRDVSTAVEYICPVIGEPAFTERMIAVQQGK